jgi:hypothetical protein
VAEGELDRVQQPEKRKTAREKEKRSKEKISDILESLVFCASYN